MLIKGILFDKDGTLLEFARTWRPIALEVINRIRKRYGLDDSYQQRLEQAIGLYSQHIDSGGSLSGGTNKDVALDFLSVCSFISDQEEFISWSTATFNEVASELPFYPVAGVLETIRRLKENNILIGLSTADSLINATLFLKKTGLYQYFDYIGADDGQVEPKPSPDYMYNFCNLYGIKAKEVGVIGDTLVDMEFADKGGAGLKIGVLSGTGTREILEGQADLIISGVKDIFVDDKLIWEDL